MAVETTAPPGEVLLARIRERIVRFAASRLSRDVAEDLAQDVLVLLTTKYADKTALEDLMPLAFRVMRLKLMAYRRRVVRRGEHTSEDVTEINLDDQSSISRPEEQLRRRELRQRLVQAASQLTGRCRELLRLKLEGHPFAHIQSQLGARSINTVYTWDSRCRQRLLELMGGAWEPSRG